MYLQRLAQIATELEQEGYPDQALILDEAINQVDQAKMQDNILNEQRDESITFSKSATETLAELLSGIVDTIKAQDLNSIDLENSQVLNALTDQGINKIKNTL